MATYVEQSIGKNETVVKQAEKSIVGLIPTWISGVLFCWLLLIPFIKAVVATIKYFRTELAVTSKRIIGRVGLGDTDSLDAPLNKIQNVSVSTPFWGKIFKYGDIKISTAADTFTVKFIKNPEKFKGAVMAQIDQYEEDRVKQQAAEMANAMTAAMQANAAPAAAPVAAPEAPAEQ